MILRSSACHQKSHLHIVILEAAASVEGQVCRDSSPCWSTCCHGLFSSHSWMSMSAGIPLAFVDKRVSAWNWSMKLNFCFLCWRTGKKKGFLFSSLDLLRAVSWVWGSAGHLLIVPLGQAGMRCWQHYWVLTEKLANFDSWLPHNMILGVTHSPEM